MIELMVIPPPCKAARNEQRKAVASTSNALAVAFLASAFLQPLVSGHSNLALIVGGSAGFIALQSVVHYVLYKVED
jgi:hypothetical protein